MGTVSAEADDITLWPTFDFLMFTAIGWRSQASKPKKNPKGIQVNRSVGILHGHVQNMQYTGIPNDLQIA